MLQRGPRSVPILLFTFLALLDLAALVPGATLVLEPLAALVLGWAVTAAWRSAASGSRAPARPAGRAGVGATGHRTDTGWPLG